MKRTLKTCLFLLVGCCYFSNSSAQNVAPFWSVGGNTNATPTNILGNKGAIDLRLVTNNTDRLKIMSTGAIGIGTSFPNGSAVLDVTSFNKGVLLPRLNTAQRNAIMSPATGLLIYQTDGVPGFYYFNAGWKPVSAAATSGGANNALSNLAGVAINTDLNPNVSAVRNLGNATLSWNNLFMRGDLFFDGRRFVSNGPAVSSSTFLGENSGIAVTTGLFNVGIGHNALLTTTTGGHNTAVGAEALVANNSGPENTAVGFEALNRNILGFGNSAVGSMSLLNNQSGNFNTAMGYQTLFLNHGSQNSAFGEAALFQNGTGSSNCAFGANALANSTTGSFNTAAGVNALNGDVIGNGNTGIGYFTNVASTVQGNSTAIGYQAVAPGSNQIQLGNGSVTVVRSFGVFVTASDGRFKKNIKENVPGLDFINQLRPVTYTYDVHGMSRLVNANVITRASTDGDAPTTSVASSDQADESAMSSKEQKIYTGFVAQEVEAAAKKSNYDFSGVYVPQSNNDIYGLSYEEFVTPLVKAVQELDKENKSLKSRLDTLTQALVEMREYIKTQKDPGGAVSLSGASLQTNMPNPFAGSTVIRYFIPQSAINAQLLITDAKGSVLKTIGINGKGNGQLTLQAGDLPAGVYNYSLQVDGIRVDTKQMIIAR